MTPAEMRAERARILANARSKFDEIKPETTEARAAEINREFDAMMASAQALEERAARAENLAAAEASLSAGDPRRPTGENGEARGVAQPGAVSYRQAFHAYLAAGGQVHAMAPEARAALSTGTANFTPEQRAQIVGTDGAGGALVPDEMMQGLVQSMAAWGPMYNEDMATVLNTTGGGSLPIPGVDDTAKEAAASGAEGSALADTGTKDVVFSKKTLEDFMYDTEWLRVSVQLVTSGMISMEQLLRDLLGERLGKIANKMLTVGTGSGQPSGIVTAAAVGKTAASLSAITADEILDFVHSVDPAYRANPKTRIMFNDSTLLALHKLKDGNGNYLIQDAPDGSGRLRIGAVSVPYKVNQAMANIGASAKTMVYGDFGRYYVRKIGAPIIGATQGREFWPGFGIAGYLRLDGTLADAKAVKAFQHPAV